MLHIFLAIYIWMKTRRLRMKTRRGRIKTRRERIKTWRWRIPNERPEQTTTQAAGPPKPKDLHDQQNHKLTTNHDGQSDTQEAQSTKMRKKPRKSR
ncbi:hypothetical protein Ddye_013564 [Dipteronia dyeriana]|uniref:Uncharacterized protein n=1 Tax=Dipteronia dyeriana TaxID=168575 RepID=A0AAD9X6V0_9ROSI|nr:hypothetical protein Ddye_013564 [Dipteronia dyeriana]